MEVRRTAPRLTSDEVALVLRRAADLEAEAEGPGAVDGFEPAAVEDAAREVGLSPAAVRQALAELHAGMLTPAAPRIRRARALALVRVPPLAVEARLVTTAGDAVHDTADSYLRRQGFALRRRHAEHALYRPRTDLGARVRRAVDLHGSIHLTGVRAVSLTVTPLDTTASAGEPAVPGAATAGGEVTIAPAGGRGGQRNLVRLEAELASGRAGARLRTTATAIATGGCIAVGGLLLGVGVVAVVAGMGSAVAARTWLRQRILRQRHDEVREVLGGLLDVIEDPSAARQPLGGSPGASRATWPSAWTSPADGSSGPGRPSLRGGWAARTGRAAR